MSDYQRIKAVRYPITKEDFIKAIGIDGDDIGYEFHNKFPGMTDWDYRKFPRFSFNYTVNNNLDIVNYLDYELYDKEGDGDWGKVRELTTKERNKYEKIFKQVLPEVDKKKLKLVEYCWYNCSEAPSYYDEVDDPFYEEV